MNLSIVASFSAAGLSFVSVLLGFRSQRRGGTEQWRRDVERPLVAEILELSDVCADKWMTVAIYRKAWLDVDPGGPREGLKGEAWDKMAAASGEAYTEYRNLRKKLAELDLVASWDVHQKADRFGIAHSSFAIALNTAGPNTAPVQAHEQILSSLGKERDALISAVRKDIGVYQGQAKLAARVRRSKRLRHAARTFRRSSQWIRRLRKRPAS